ncbi:MAG: M48 family metallopeptidase [Pontibacterium sp.]
MSHPEIQYEIVRSPRRRTASIKVEPGQVRVLVPAWVGDDWVAGWVQQKQLWIQQRQQQIAEQIDCHQIRIVQGADLPYLDETLTLSWSEGGRTHLAKTGDQLSICLSRRGSRAPALRVEALVKSWYEAQAQIYLSERLNHWQQQMDLEASALKVKGFRRRWGSCDSRGGIVLNWRLILTPSELIDYVVVHELAHLVHFNHSKNFWALVKRYIPDYPVLKQALQQRHVLLCF